MTKKTENFKKTWTEFVMRVNEFIYKFMQNAVQDILVDLAITLTHRKSLPVNG